MKGEVRRADANCRAALFTNPAFPTVVGINRREKNVVRPLTTALTSWSSVVLLCISWAYT